MQTSFVPMRRASITLGDWRSAPTPILQDFLISSMVIAELRGRARLVLLVSALTFFGVATVFLSLIILLNNIDIGNQGR